MRNAADFFRYLFFYQTHVARLSAVYLRNRITVVRSQHSAKMIVFQRGGGRKTYAVNVRFFHACRKNELRKRKTYAIAKHVGAAFYNERRQQRAAFILRMWRRRTRQFAYVPYAKAQSLFHILLDERFQRYFNARLTFRKIRIRSVFRCRATYLHCHVLSGSGLIIHAFRGIENAAVLRSHKV